MHNKLINKLCLQWISGVAPVTPSDPDQLYIEHFVEISFSIAPGAPFSPILLYDEFCVEIGFKFSIILLKYVMFLMDFFICRER